MSYDNNKKLVDKNSLSLYTKKLLEVLNVKFNNKTEIIEGPPQSAPKSIGDIKFDSVNNILYMSVDTKSLESWIPVKSIDDLEYATLEDIDDLLNEL